MNACGGASAVTFAATFGRELSRSQPPGGARRAVLF